MARPYRLQEGECFYHITSRGDDRKKIFISESDYQRFLKYLAAAKEKYKFYLHAYCLMPNHYHLFIETTKPNLSRIMQYLNTAYSIYYNVRHKRCGHLFQGRYKSIIVESDAYFAELTRYIHLNPVRAGIVGAPGQYCWTSYNAYIKNKDDSCVDINRVKQFVGMNMREYEQFVEGAGEDYLDPFKNVCAGFMLGREEFIKDKLKRLQIDVESKDIAHKRAVKSIIEPSLIIKAVANYFKIHLQEVCFGKRRPMIAKKAAIYLMRRKTGMTNQQIGDMFAMKHAAVSMAANDFEKKMANDEELKSMVNRIVLNFEV